MNSQALREGNWKTQKQMQHKTKIESMKHDETVLNN